MLRRGAITLAEDKKSEINMLWKIYIKELRLKAVGTIQSLYVDFLKSKTLT